MSLREHLTPAEQAEHEAALQEKMRERRKAERKRMDERNKKVKTESVNADRLTRVTAHASPSHSELRLLSSARRARAAGAARRIRVCRPSIATTTMSPSGTNDGSYLPRSGVRNSSIET